METETERDIYIEIETETDKRQRVREIYTETESQREKVHTCSGGKGNRVSRDGRKQRQGPDGDKEGRRESGARGASG